jgi:glycosyltransferase involved in cell wall biosynthesis
MSPILFWDPSCQRPYDTQSVRDEATGGSEASVSRIADALDAYVVQHNRTTAAGRYLPPGRIAGISHVVVSRDPRALREVRALYPDARILLWVHDQIHPGSTRGRRLARSARELRELEVTIVCVSDSQREGVEATLRRMSVEGKVRALTIYNPVPDALAFDGSTVDKDKLVFFSSPNKGLKFTLDAFRTLHRKIPQMRLVVGNPGYKRRKFPRIEGVNFIGPQAPAVIHAEVSTALCTFFPNFVIPETFGLVFAESLALGTPVLTHDCGAAREVIGDPAQLLPVTRWHRAYESLLNGLSSELRSAPARVAGQLGLFDAYVERIAAWRDGARPQCGPDPRFRLSTVAGQWRAVLADRTSR